MTDLTCARGVVDAGGAVEESVASARPRVLLVTFGSVLEPQGGLQVRARILAETLAGMGIAPSIVSTREPYPISALPTWARRFQVPRRKPRRGFSREFVRLIRAAAERCDVVVITNAMFMPAIALSRTRLPVIWDTNECQTLHYRRLPRSLRNRAGLLVWFGLERWAARRCQVAVAISTDEAQAWQRIHPRLRDKVTTVDHAPLAIASSDGEPRSALKRHLGELSDGPVLVFVGTMAAKHNAEAARWLLDVLAPALPAPATLVLCGPGSDRLASTAPRTAARVACLGAVDNVDAIIAAADLCLAPLAAGAGVKTKVLHYLGHGKRVAGTPIAFEGIADAPGLYRASLGSLPALVARLLADDEPVAVASARSAAEQAWLERHHGRERVSAQWMTVLKCLRTT